MRVFRNEYFESLWLPLAGFGLPPGPSAGLGQWIVDGQVRLGYNFKIPIFKQFFFLQNTHIQNCRPVPNCDLRTNTTNLMQISSAVYEQFLLQYSFAKKF